MKSYNFGRCFLFHLSSNCISYLKIRHRVVDIMSKKKLRCIILFVSCTTFFYIFDLLVHY